MAVGPQASGISSLSSLWDKLLCQSYTVIMVQSCTVWKHMLELSQLETLWQHDNLDAKILALNIVVNVPATYLPEPTIREERSAESQDEQCHLETSLQLHKLRVAPVCPVTGYGLLCTTFKLQYDKHYCHSIEWYVHRLLLI